MTTDTADEILSDYLFARPSFLEGVARLVDPAGSLNAYNVSPTAEEADARAMDVDVAAIGRDLRVAVTRTLAEPSRR